MEFNENQKKAIEKINGNLAIIATAGSGKTGVLTQRIANMVENEGINPNSILAVTFSKKAKESMQEKLEKLTDKAKYVNIETFHSLAYKIIRTAYGNKYEVWTADWQKEKVINEICENLYICNKEDVPYNDIVSFIATQKNCMLSPDDKLIRIMNMPYSMETMTTIYTKYERHMRVNNLIEFDDFLNIACDIFENHAKILEYYRGKAKYILSDEYQDVSMNQSKLIRYLGDASNNVFIVGDNLQSIYAFRGGDSKYMLDFDREWEDVEVINLNINYRCSSDIVSTANAFASQIPDSEHRYYVEAVANKGPYKKPIYTPYESSKNEGEGIAKRINGLFESDYESYDDFSILTRTNAQLQKIAIQLFEEGVPFDLMKGRIFLDLPEVKLLTYYLRLGEDPSDDEAFEYVYNKPLRWLGKKFLEEVKIYARMYGKSLFYAMNNISRRQWRYKKGIEEIQKTIRHLQYMDGETIDKQIRYLRGALKIDYFVSKGNLGDDGLSEQSENMDSFADICKNYTSVKELLLYLESIQKSVEDESDKGKVKLLTIHRSKGLEFPAVFIAGCSDGLLPHGRTLDIHDEQRLMYVGMTRAEKELYLSSVKYYNERVYEESEFIDMLGDTVDIEYDENQLELEAANN